MVYRKSNVRFHRKRWYLNAEANAFGYKGKIALGNRALANKRKRSIIKTVRNVTFPHRVWYQAFTDTPYTHNTIFTYNPMAQIGQGTRQDQRTGDNIFLKYLKVKLAFRLYFNNLPAAGSDIRLRCLIIKSDEDWNPNNDRFGSGIGSSSLFFDASNPSTAITDKRKVQVIKDKTYVYSRPNSGTSLDKTITLGCGVNKKFTYNGSGGTYSKTTNYYILIIPFGSEASLTSTVLLNMHGDCIVGFTDA